MLFCALIGLLLSLFSATGGPLGLVAYVAKFSIGFGKEFVASHVPIFDLSSPYGDG
jgi:hypothetical protein